MSSFNNYDVLGYVIPGGLLLIIVMFYCPFVKSWFGEQKIEFAGIGSALIIAFVLGHFINQTNYFLGIGVRFAPLDWISGHQPPCIDDAAMKILLPALKTRFNNDKIDLSHGCDLSASRGLVTQMHIAVRDQKKNDRLDIFNQNRALFESIGTVFLLLAAATFILNVIRIFKKTIKIANWIHPAVLCIAAVMAFDRMEYFSDLWGRELLLTFISLKP